jgi:hypothetical protein
MVLPAVLRSAKLSIETKGYRARHTVETNQDRYNSHELKLVFFYFRVNILILILTGGYRLRIP